MKKSLIFILTVITVLIAVSCDINELGSTMLSLNKNFFYPATADTKAVEDAISELPTLFSKDQSGQDQFDSSKISGFAQAAVADILAFGADNDKSQEAYIAKLDEKVVLDGDNASNYKLGLLDTDVNGSKLSEILEAANNSVETALDQVIPGTTALVGEIVESLAGDSKKTYTQKDLVVVGIFNDMANCIAGGSPDMNTLIQDVKLLGILMPENIGDRITDLFGGFMDAMLNSDSE